tara:strand:- start:958 stop:1215 length:258 start_codon:yes stop_codon:yes gene_type:complete
VFFFGCIRAQSSASNETNATTPTQTPIKPYSRRRAMTHEEQSVNAKKSIVSMDAIATEKFRMEYDKLTMNYLVNKKKIHKINKSI